MNKTGIFWPVAVSAGITFFLRALPFLAFRKGRKMPEKLVWLGNTLPSAIMAVLIVYCLKDITGDFVQYGIPELLSAALVAVTYKWKHNILLSIVSGTVCNMVLLQVVQKF